MFPVVRNALRVGILGAIAAGMCAPAGATIVGGTVTGGTAFAAGGTFVLLTVPLGNPLGAPNSVGNNTFQTPNLYGFDEDQNVVAGPGALATDTGVNPIAAGTIVASHYIFFDPDPSQHIIGTVDFDSDILAIISSTGNLAASDYLANTGVNYLNPSARGLEPRDSVTINGPRQILFDTFASTPGDYVRVLTKFSPGAPVPEPGMGVLLALGTAFLLRTRRRRGG